MTKKSKYHFKMKIPQNSCVGKEIEGFECVSGSESAAIRILVSHLVSCGFGCGNKELQLGVMAHVKVVKGGL